MRITKQIHKHAPELLAVSRTKNSVNSDLKTASGAIHEAWVR
jgi:hypothetical protein